MTLESIAHGEDLHDAGFIVAHQVGETGWCRAALVVDDAHFPHKWSLTGTLAGGDLTLAPSVACKAHPEFHAFIQNGRWTG